MTTAATMTATHAITKFNSPTVTNRINRIRSMTLEDWNTVLQFSSAVLGGVTFAVGAATIVTGYFVSKRLDLRVAQAQSTAANAVAQSRQLEGDVAKQQERAATAERDLLLLKRAVAPRRITPEQQQEIVRLLNSATSKGRVSVSTFSNNAEPLAYAEEIRKVLAVAGWAAGDHVEQNLIGGDLAGLTLHVAESATALSDEGTNLLRAFQAAGLTVRPIRSPLGREGKLTLGVGDKRM
jgi:hypothetical protein